MNFSKTKNSSSKQSLGGQKIVPILFLASLLVIWELACKLFSIPLYVLPSPVQVIQSLFTESATLSHHAAVTVMEAVIGILLSPDSGDRARHPYGLLSSGPPGHLPASCGNTDSSDDCAGADSHHLYGIWHRTENPDRYPDVLLPDRRQLFRRSGTGR